MDRFPGMLALQCRAALSVGLILAFSCNVASSAENCERLEALANQYAGVALTSAQKQSQAEDGDVVLDALHAPRGPLSLATACTWAAKLPAGRPPCDKSSCSTGAGRFGWGGAAWNSWMVAGACIVGFAGLYWLWDEHINAGPRSKN